MFFLLVTLLQHRERRGEFATLRATLHGCVFFLWRHLLGRCNKQMPCIGGMGSTKWAKVNPCFTVYWCFPTPTTTYLDWGTFEGNRVLLARGNGSEQIFGGNGKDDLDRAGSTAWHLLKLEIHCKFWGRHQYWRNGFSLPWQSWHEIGLSSNMLLYTAKREAVLQYLAYLTRTLNFNNQHVTIAVAVSTTLLFR